MNWIVVEGVKPWDGRYELDLVDLELTTREWGWIKRLSGYMPLTVDQGFKGGDAELFAVFAAIALRRAGRVDTRDVPDVFDRLVDAPFGTTIRLESDSAEDEAEDDADPPGSSTGNTPSSGDGSPTSSETSAHPPNGSGIHGSDTSTSVPARSGT